MHINELLQLLSERIAVIRAHKFSPLRIAINGIEGSGKTSLAMRLVDYLNEQGQAAVHITIDGYHNVKAKRYQQGRDSAQGYYDDAFNERAFVQHVLLKSQTKPYSYVPKIHDLESDQLLPITPIQTSASTIFVIDGSYLFKPIYLSHWDYKIYLKVSYAVAMKRGVERDAQLLGGQAQAEEKYIIRYHAAAKLYDQLLQPETKADLIIDNNDFLNPNILASN